MRFDSLVSFLFPEQAAISTREKIISALAACIAIAAVIWASQQLAQSEHRPFVIASMGSSAVLLFAVFHSPLSQPWALVGGHLVSAAISVLCAYHITNPVIATVDAPAGRATRPEHDDIVAALKSMDTFIDVAEEDLERIYLLATINRQKRSLGSVFCRDIMTRNVTSVSPQSALSSVWNVLRQRNIRGVPVLDEDRRVVGMVAISDFLKNTDWDWNRRSRLRCLLTSPRHRGRRPTS